MRKVLERHFPPSHSAATSITSLGTSSLNRIGPVMGMSVVA
ncbi:hypothetical protein SF83666_b64310 (plasmid) [Sinorhizobium fredii CCBAU 83666]|nr:hypothetical protein SF83666_b64310 [Sinorhizobium fredii CCBAU 83666]